MPASFILNYRIDTVVFCVLAILILWLGTRFMRHKQRGLRFPPFVFALAAALTAGGAWFAEFSGNLERAQIRQLVSGLAPTFANEMEMLGHAKISLQTPPDDPLYLTLIEREKTWLKLNPFVADIYTYRRLPDGKIVFIVDAETDYDHNGRYDTDREQRTRIGEPYETATANTLLALAGHPVFDTEIVTDQWGTWISFDQPMFDEHGNVEAVLGVDFPVNEWISAILRERATSLVIACIVLIILVAVSVLITLMRAEIEERTRIQRELLRAKEEAEKADHAKSEFLATMSHEIRTPMNSIIGFGDLLLDTPLTHEQHEYAATLKKSGQSLLALLNDILDLSKIEARQTRLESIPFSLLELLGDIAGLAEARTGEKKLTFTLENNTGELNLVGDPTRLRQVLLNLVSNAIKFTETGGVILRAGWTPIADRLHGILRFDIIDTGIGIPPEKLGFLFQKFAQADASTTRRYGGTGLGLVISRTLVQLMGGTLTVQSEAGRGSTFTVELPASLHQGPLPEAPAFASPPASSNAPSNGGSGTVLLVEDNLINRRLASLMLEKLGFGVEMAADGREALSLFSKREYYAVLMDCEMPELDGFEATRSIRTLEQTTGVVRRTPIIALTANAMQGTRQRCLEAGMDLYLTKPIRLEILRDALALFSASKN
ncbi:MAG: response regulator [Verrucomicrobia bacterium]|nr:response regulator [Verrucomicrobiota bacterium]